MRELETARLKLRHVTENDVQDIYDCWASDPEVTKYLTWNAHKSIDETKEIMKFWLDEYKKPDRYRYGIELKDSGDLIGMIDVVGFHNGAPVIGYCSGRAYWGNGYMTEALDAVVSELFENSFDTIVIEAVDENIASNMVILKNGFTLVGSRTEPLSKDKPDNIVTINSYRLYKK
ncbi:MAG: GNAT family N-acetyltransferase [Ruminococcus sp.]|nr:GNAT family N-acetyltransferase [Ruminococcus sp.]